MAESKEELKSLLMKVKEENEKADLKLNIQNTKIKKNKTKIFMGSKITTNGDSSNEIKRRLLLGRKAITNLDSILKSRDVTLPTKVHLVKAIVFPVVTYGCESWTIMKD